MSSPDVRLTVAGQRYGGWEKIRVVRGMEQVAGGFELSVSERWPGQETARPIAPGQSCTLSIDGSTVITGWVDDVGVEYDGEEHTVTVSGRDATGDLVDCSAPSTQFSGRTLAEVARTLCSPFGIKVKDQAGASGAFSKLKNNEGDSVFETLEAAAKVRAVLLLSDGLGNLVICRAGAGRVSTPLALGQNVIRCNAQYSFRDRFSAYAVKGQTHSRDTWNGDAAAQPLGTARDANVTRHRPLIVLAEENVEASSAQERAEWEASVRYGKGRRVTYTVHGWSHAGGLWTPNVLVPVRDDFLGLSCDLLLVEVRLLLDKQGRRSELALSPVEAYRRVAVPETGEGEGGW